MGIKRIQGDVAISNALMVAEEIYCGEDDNVIINASGIAINGSPVITEETLNALPEYSDNNDGQFLRIIDGEPTWSTVPNAEEASF